MALHRRRAGETVAQEKARLRRQNTVPGRSATGRVTLPSKASGIAKQRSFKRRGVAKRSSRSKGKT